MSSSSANGFRSALDQARTVVPTATPVRRLAFWMAIGLPAVYLPFLALGLETPTQATAFVALLCCNAVALLIGHSHMRE